MGTVHRQVIIIGAGIAGLWTLRRLIASGYDAILLESEKIGSGQTLGSQGILHGGVKYGLDGSDRGIAARLRELPPLWLECLEGKREPSLQTARVLSRCQHLWAADSWLARVGATVGARAMQGEVRKLTQEDWPEALAGGGHKGSVYELKETVIAVKSVLAALAEPVKDRIFQGAIQAFERGQTGGLRSIGTGGLKLTADVFIFTAATGNEAAAEAAGFGPATAQRRPLKQIMVRGNLPELFGHCVTVTPKPVVTITSHALGDDRIWYLGGGVAETATGLPDREAMLHARQVLGGVFPRLAWEGLSWSCWSVNRAEPHASSRLPDGPALAERGSTALAWPTKLVYAPSLADQALEFVKRQTSLNPAPVSPPAIPLPMAEMGTYPWEDASWHLL